MEYLLLYGNILYQIIPKMVKLEMIYKWFLKNFFVF